MKQYDPMTQRPSHHTWPPELLRALTVADQMDLFNMDQDTTGAFIVVFQR